MGLIWPIIELSLGGSYLRYNELTRLLIGAMEEGRKSLIKHLGHLYSEPLLEGP
jgi:hypothetical protein